MQLQDDLNVALNPALCIPWALSRLADKGTLQEFDLSCNQITGDIPLPIDFVLHALRKACNHQETALLQRACALHMCQPEYGCRRDIAAAIPDIHK